MNLRPSLIISGAIVLGSLCLGLLMNQPSWAQPLAAGTQVGRYQAFHADSGGRKRVILCDTTTGECFVHWAEANEGKGAWYTASPPWPKGGKPAQI